MSDTWREWEGQVVDGAFSLRRHLGGSDHSVVFLTERGEGKQKAAIKFVQAGAEAQLSRWQQVAQLSHPNLIKLFETGRCHLAGMDLLYVVMEYAEENLAQFLPQRPLTPAETRDMLEPFLDALQYLHAQGLVHAHIKPGNILAIDDQLKLSSDSICRAGESRRTVEKPDAYAPPEAATQKISPADDVWALGVTLVETLTQQVPAVQEPEEPNLPDTLTEPFLDITRHCLLRDPQRRWTVADIANRLNPSAAPQAPAIPAAVATSPIAAALAPSTAVPGTVTPTVPAPFLDPLSVPLSTVSPQSPQNKHALQNQLVSRPTPYGHFVPQKNPARSYYIVFGVLLALTLGAMLAIPRLRNHGSQSDPASSSTPSQPAPVTPARVEPAAPSKPQLKSQPKPAAAPADQFPQRSALPPTPKTQKDSLQAANEKQPAKKDPSAPDPAAAPASLRSAVPRSDPAPSGPLASNKDSGIAAGSVTPGEVLSQVLPEISQRSRNTIHGTLKIVVKVHVDSSGNVAAAEVASGPSRFFSEAALQSARRWDFAPAKVDGQAVPSEWLLHFDFTSTNTNVTPLATKP